jgi:hypothetical protein
MKVGAEKLNTGVEFSNSSGRISGNLTKQEICSCTVMKAGFSSPIMRTIPVIILIACGASLALAQKSAPLSADQLAEITARGRMLAEYDRAAWRSTDAVMATHPKEDSNGRFVCRKSDKSWTCVFGHLGTDKFLIDYEAVQGESPEEFHVQRHEPPAEDTGFYFAGVKAMMVAGKDFQTTAENRPYNPSVLPAPSGQLYVYMVPAQTQNGVFPFGGDARYLVTADGNTIVEKRQLHKAILEMKTQDAAPGKTAGGWHTHVLSDVPEDTDVLYVLSRKPLVPEFIGTGDKKHVRIYVVNTDGAIKVSK